MKYLNILCNSFELNCLFPEAELLESECIGKSYNTLKIKNKEDIIDVNHYLDDIFLKISNSNNLMHMDSYYINPPNDLTIICDRKLWYELYFPLLKNNKSDFHKLEQIYVDRNVEVFFNFAILEAVN